MKIIAVDDEQLMLDALVACIRKVEPDAELMPFHRAGEALAYVQEHPVDVAFLDIRMRGMDGLELGKRLLDLYPALNIIYCTSYDEYISEAFRNIRCNGYVMKPVDIEQIQSELSHLRLPFQNEKIVAPCRVVFRCLGRFEVFVDGEPVKFENSKTKELLAYLVDASGGICNNQEIIAKLWEDDRRHDSYFKKIRKDLIDTLEALGCEDILCRHRGGLGINADLVKCDYYDWRKENPGKKPEIYMSQYFWALIPDFEW